MSGAYHLSDLDTEKVEIECDCGMKRRYDRRALMARIGDHDLPSLLRKLADAEGCRRAYSVDIYQICQMGYAKSCVVGRKPR